MKIIKKYRNPASRLTAENDNTTVSKPIITNLPVGEDLYSITKRAKAFNKALTDAEKYALPYPINLTPEEKFYMDLALIGADENERLEIFKRYYNTPTIGPENIAAKTGHIQLNPKTGDVIGYTAPTTVSAAPLTEGQRMWLNPALNLALSIPFAELPYIINNANYIGNIAGTAKKVYSSPIVTKYSVSLPIQTGGSLNEILPLAGYQLRSFLKGSPIERFVLPNGMISTRTIRQYMSNPKRLLLDRRVALYVLDNEFKGLTHVDYNLFRKALLKYLVHPEVLVLNYGMQEGVMAAYPYPIFVNEAGLEALRDDAVFMHKAGLIDDTKYSKNISKGLSASPQGNGVYKIINRRNNRAATARDIGHLLGSGNYLSTIQNENFGEAYFNEDLPIAFLDENQEFLNKWYNLFGFNKNLHLSYFRDLNNPNILYSVDNKIFLPNYRNASKELKRFVIDPNNDINKSRVDLATSAMTLAKLRKTYPKMILELKALPLTSKVESAIFELQDQLQDALALYYWRSMLKYDPKRITAVYHNLKHLNETTLLRLLEMGEKLKANRVRIPTRKTYKTIQFDDDGYFAPYYEDRFSSEKLARIYLHLFKKEVPVVNDDLGREWFELEVPQNYLNSERIYKKGGKI